MEDIIVEIPRLRLGRATRSGHGRMSVVRYHASHFDLTKSADLERFRRLPVGLHESVPAEILGKVQRLAPSTAGSRVLLEIALSPNDHWIFGNGRPLRDAHTRLRTSEKDAIKDPVDRAPISEDRIVWQGDRAKIEKDLHYIPGSSLKGLLRHRVAFHVRRLRQTWAGSTATQGTNAAEELDEIQWLFGHTKDSADSTNESEAPGRLFIDDIPIPLNQADSPKDGLLEHVSLDRFTQGPMSGLLFTEAPFFKGRFVARIEVDNVRKPTDLDTKMIERAQRAFRLALGDAIEGRLAWGAGANHGFGFASGSVKSISHPEWSPLTRGNV